MYFLKGLLCISLRNCFHFLKDALYISLRNLTEENSYDKDGKLDLDDIKKYKYEKSLTKDTTTNTAKVLSTVKIPVTSKPKKNN